MEGSNERIQLNLRSAVCDSSRNKRSFESTFFERGAIYQYCNININVCEDENIDLRLSKRGSPLELPT